MKGSQGEVTGSVRNQSQLHRKQENLTSHKVELDPVKETNMSRNEHEETSETTEATVNVWMQ